MFETLADEGINIEMISTSTIRISCVVRGRRVERAVQVLHAAFELDSEQAYSPHCPSAASERCRLDGVGNATGRPPGR